MNYDPRNYIVDLSWIPHSIRQAGDVVSKIPQVVEMNAALKEGRVNKQNIYDAVKDQVSTVPDDAFAASGTTKEQLLKYLPSPSKSRSETTEQYLQKVSSWYTPVVNALSKSGMSAQDITSFARQAPHQVKAGESVPVRKVIEEKEGEQIGRVAQAAMSGRQETPTGETTASGMPIRKIEATGAPANAEEFHRRFGEMSQQSFAGETGQSIAPGTTTEDLRKNPAYSSAVSSLQPAEKPITAYQQARLDIDKKYKAALIARGSQRANEDSESDFNRNARSLWENMNDFSVQVDKSSASIQALTEREQEIKAAIAKNDAIAGDVLYDQAAKDAAQKKNEALKNELLDLPSKQDKAIQRGIEARNMELIGKSAWSIYVDADGRISYGEALRRAKANVEGGSDVKPKQGTDESVPPPRIAPQVPKPVSTTVNADTIRQQVQRNHPDWDTAKVERYIQHLRTQGKL